MRNKIFQVAFSGFGENEGLIIENCNYGTIDIFTYELEYYPELSSNIDDSFNEE